MRWGILLSIMILFCCQTPVTAGLKIENKGKVMLSDDVLLANTSSYCITEDNKIIVTDSKINDVKIYNIDGHWLKSFGRRGFGPNEFGLIVSCDYSARRLVISDAVQKKIFVYDRKGEMDFERTKDIRLPSIGTCIQLYDNTVYLANESVSPEGKFFGFSAVQLNNDKQIIYILPAFVKYGLKSDDEYKKEFLEKREFALIGAVARFDIADNFAYYFWEGDLRILKIDLKTKTYISFGEKTANYSKPKVTQKMIDIFSSGDMKRYSMEKSKMSYVRGIFVASKYAIVIYSAEKKNDDEDTPYIAQFYTLKGQFVEEHRLPGKCSSQFCFDKKSNMLYTTIYTEDENLDSRIAVQKFKIYE